jgi:hypothetical protein
MKKWTALILNALILLSIQSCANVTSSPSLLSQSLAKSSDSELVLIAPEIPFNPEEAFFPLRVNKEGLILPTYQWRECAKRFIWCTKWIEKRVEFKDLSWFHAQGFGLSKRKGPTK